MSASRIVLAACVATLALSACNRDRDKAAPDAPAPAPGAAATPADAGAPLGYESKSPYASVTLTLPPALKAQPDLHAALYAAAVRDLRQFVEGAQADRTEAGTEPGMAPYEKTIEMQAAAETGKLLSLKRVDYDYTGGAHGNSLFAGVLWDKALKRQITVADLFRKGADSRALGVARWTNVMDFVDWIARRCEADDDAGRGRGNVLQVAQTITVILSLAERGDDADVVTLSTLHAAKGLEWPHVVLAGVVEGLLPFRADGEALSAERLHEERRLRYVGITRAQRTLLVSTLRRRKRGRETVPAQPSRFVAEMKLDAAVVKDDPRERLKRLRAELAARVPSEETPS